MYDRGTYFLITMVVQYLVVVITNTKDTSLSTGKCKGGQ